MYDAPTRTALKERGDYESWLIRECLLVLSEQQGVQAPVTIEVRDDGTAGIYTQITESLGAGYAAEVVRKLIPLLLTSGYKLLDMVIEWCLYENGITPTRAFFSFKEKIQQSRPATISWPDFLNSTPHLKEVLTAVYASLRHKRNAIIHHSWGTAQNGALKFDFSYVDDLDPARPTLHDHDLVSEATVLAFSEFSALLFARLSDLTTQSGTDVPVLLRLSNGFQTLHGRPSVSVGDALFFRVIRKTSLDMLDLSFIKSVIKRVHPSVTAIEFELEIERGAEFWRVPAKDVSKLGRQVPLSDLGAFLAAGS